MTLSAEAAAALLSAHADYRILRRLDPNAVGGPPLTKGTVRRAAIIDTETTGMDPKEDRVIEIGIVVFEYGVETGEVGPVVGHLSALEDPGRPIPPETTAIHHITDEMVRGKRFDDEVITRLLSGVSLIIAHNASFDRPFLENRMSLFKNLPWACSIRDVDWRNAGYGSSALEFLVYRSGFFYEGHRAEIDCRAVLAVLARPLGKTGRSALGELLEHARQPSYRVAALDSPFELKDLLKTRGYRWNADAKVWVRDITDAERAAEFAWLRAAIYGGNSVEVEMETLDAKRRYSGREGKKERVSL